MQVLGIIFLHSVVNSRFVTFCWNTKLNCNNYVFFHLKFEIFSSYKLPKESPPLIDLDWLASDLPITTHTNGAIFVMTMDLNNSTSSMAQMDLDGMYLCLTPPTATYFVCKL